MVPARTRGCAGAFNQSQMTRWLRPPRSCRAASLITGAVRCGLMRDNRRSAPPPRYRDGAARRGTGPGAGADRSAAGEAALVALAAIRDSAVALGAQPQVQTRR